MDKQNDKEKLQVLKPQIQLLKQKYLKKAQAAQPIPQKQKSTKQQQHEKTLHQIVIPKKLNQELQTRLYTHAPKHNKIASIVKQIVEDEKNIKSDKQIQEHKTWNMKDYLSEKQNHQIIHKKQQTIDQFEKYQPNLNDPFALKVNFQLGNQKRQQNIDPQFDTALDHHSDKRSDKPKQIYEINKTVQKDMVQACKIWTENPQKLISFLYSMNTQSQQGSKSLTLTSKNPSFPGIVQHLAQQFVFSNNQVLKQSQKQVVYNMALQYFSPSPQHLSDVLLICLVKILPTYASTYADEIIGKIQYYSLKIVQYRRYILKDELDNFVKCIEERLEVLRIQGTSFGNQCYIRLLFLKPNSNYCHQILLTRNIEIQSELMAIFSILYADNKETLQSILYLKCIDSLIPLFNRAAILEKVISHLGQIKVPQAFYQPVKSLKLKLIRAADPKKQKRKGEQDKGFVNFLNERITKLRDNLEAKVNQKTKQPVILNQETGQFEPVPTQKSIA